VKPQDEYTAIPTSPVSVKPQDNYTTIPTSPVNAKPQDDYNTISTSLKTSNFNSHPTYRQDEVSKFSSTHSDRTLEKEPSDEVEAYKSNSTYYSSSTNKQSFPVSTTIESRNDTRSWNIRENTGVNTLFSQESTSYRPTTNKGQCSQCE
jgi:hypothetical protein